MPQISSLTCNNGLSQRNPWIKTGIGIFLLVLVLVNGSILCHLVITVLLFGSMTFFAKLPARRVAELYTLPLVFLCMNLSAMVLSFQVDRTDYLLSAKFLHMGLNYAPVEIAKKIFFRSMAGISAIYFIVLATPTNQMIYLLKFLHTPEAFTEQMALIYRSVAILFNEFHIPERALILEGGYRNKFLMIRSSSIIAGALLDSMVKSFTSYKIALDCKLFGGYFYL